MKNIASIILLVCVTMCNLSCQKTNTVTLITLDPGHFHAALVQKSMLSNVSPDVYVYAPDGTDVQDQLARIDSYNTRKDNPTKWIEHCYTGPDYLNKMLDEKKGNVVIIAGSNRLKTDYIKSCIDARLNVLADKPMCIDSNGFEMLKTAFDSAKKNNVLLYDIMTERYEIASILQKELANTPEVFGNIKTGSQQDPSIVKESVHNFYKIVSGKPLKRPAWYYDTAQQGEGIVDVTTHLVDLAMWEAFPEQAIDYKDVQIVSSTRRPTIITKDQFSKSTQLDDFPDFLKSRLDGSGNLPCFANGEINFTLKGVYTKVSVVWNFEPPAGGGDTHYSVMKGSKAGVIILQGKDQNYIPELFVEPAQGLTLDQSFDSVSKAVAKLETKYPGVAAMRETNRIKIVIPQSYRVGHEAHFAQVTEKYLKFLKERKMPDWEVPNMLTKYFITTQALTIAETKPAK